MRRLVRWGAGAMAVVLLVVLGPLVLRLVPFFAVRRVELVGLRYLAPQRVLSSLSIEADRNVFDPVGGLVAQAESLPGIVRADVARRLPGTLRLELEEELPIAFARGKDGLVPVDVAARPLPYDPAVTAFDLPIVERADPVLTRALALVRDTDSALFASVDGARRGYDRSVVLELGEERVLLKEEPQQSDIRAVLTVRWHLAESDVPYSVLDARFAGWVVVRREKV